MWIDENAYYEYHCVKGHKTSNCMRLKHCIQDLIDKGGISFDEQPKQSPNSNLKAYKDPLPNHNKGKGSLSNQAYNIVPPPAFFDSIVGRIEESSNHVNTIIIWAQTPDCIVTTCHGRVSIRGAPTNDQLSTSAPTNPPSTHKYNLLDHLDKTPAQISILELLHTSPLHKEVLDKALMETQVPTNLNFDQFQAMVGHIASPHHLTFSEKDLPTSDNLHNDALHIEVRIHKHIIKRVLIDGGSSLNLCTLKLLKHLG